jgi:hypothetical protein
MAWEQAVQAFHFLLGDDEVDLAPEAQAQQVQALQAELEALWARTSRLLFSNARMVAITREVLEELAKGTPQQRERAAEGEVELRRLVVEMEQATLRCEQALADPQAVLARLRARAAILSE